MTSSTNTTAAVLAASTPVQHEATDLHDTYKAANDLLEYLYDSYNGFHNCADDIKDTTLKSLFAQIASTRHEMISELTRSIQQLGQGEPTKSGSTAAKLHRGLIDFKALFTGGKDNSTIIKEVHRGESYTIEKYQEVLDRKALTPDLRTLLQQQLQKIKDQNKAVEAMR
ncbi:unnamed protein product [Didymodactylos carnosus]|nr:unnamed protein product [Didymodactylos carnosus]CAF3897035.1 unnamed protein product [Didymodactylos carnosus]